MVDLLGVLYKNFLMVEEKYIISFVRNMDIDRTLQQVSLRKNVVITKDNLFASWVETRGQMYEHFRTGITLWLVPNPIPLILI